MIRRLLAVVLVTASTLSAKDVDFAHDVVPILKAHCAKCHTGPEKKGGLSLSMREAVLAGGETGPAVVVGKGAESELLTRVTSEDETLRMPPQGPRVPHEKVAILRQWIDQGLPWEPGFTFSSATYEPPLKPRRPELPPARDGRENPLDRILDADLAQTKTPRPARLDDAAFARRAWLDLIGLLPTPEELDAFLKDGDPIRRTKLVRTLLARDVDYAEYWLTFWNDLLRNDYTGTGFITGGRKQISKWLYEALVTNKPYDQFARELIAPPTEESVGFIEGIRWRGEVSAGQTVEIQFAQSLGQSFLGINLKCASCHDSFIDRWKLDESFGLAAVYATRPLELHRCDKPTGKIAQAAWLFPELGQIDAKAAQPERLKQLAALMTHPENGRFPRAIVNRLWHRLMGRGIVDPPDAMQSSPWNADLLDTLAVHLVDRKYDLKAVLELIATSEAYGSQVEGAKAGSMGDYVYAGPRTKRLTAEQFVDAVWQITETAPAQFDAPVLRGKVDPNAPAMSLTGHWIWSRADSSRAAAGETVTFHRTWTLSTAPAQAVAAISCDNSYVLYVNGQKVHAGENWEAPDAVLLTSRLKAGDNELLLIGKNAGNAPNPAGIRFEARAMDAVGKSESLGSDAKWEWTATSPDPNGKFAKEPDDWKPAVAVASAQVWSRAEPAMASILARGGATAGRVRASLVKRDFLMGALGRPNRDQIVTVRPAELTTLEAMDLSNGPALADMLARGAKNLLAKTWDSPEAFARWLYRLALSREPLPEELQALKESIGTALTEEGVQDALWSVLMLPEFQLIR